MGAWHCSTKASKQATPNLWQEEGSLLVVCAACSSKVQKDMQEEAMHNTEFMARDGEMPIETVRMNTETSMQLLDDCMQ